MLQFSCIRNFKLTANIPKRSRGHVEVVVNVSVQSRSDKDPVDFIMHLLPYNNQTLSKELLISMANTLVDNLQLQNVQLSFSFIYPTERVSPTYNSLTYGVQCEYEVIYPYFDNTAIPKYAMNMLINFPMQYKNVLIVPADTIFLIRDVDNSVHFEDMIDHIQKIAGIKLYPVTRGDERVLLQEEISKGHIMSVDKYFEEVRTSSIKKGWYSGSIRVHAMDLYNIYKIEHGVDW